MSSLLFAFGDFRFHGLVEGTCFLAIGADGFVARTFSEIGTENDVRHVALTAGGLSEEISA